MKPPQKLKRTLLIAAMVGSLSLVIAVVLLLRLGEGGPSCDAAVSTQEARDYLEQEITFAGPIRGVTAPTGYVGEYPGVDVGDVHVAITDPDPPDPWRFHSEDRSLLERKALGKTACVRAPLRSYLDTGSFETNSGSVYIVDSADSCAGAMAWQEASEYRDRQLTFKGTVTNASPRRDFPGAIDSEANATITVDDVYIVLTDHGSLRREVVGRTACVRAKPGYLGRADDWEASSGDIKLLDRVQD